MAVGDKAAGGVEAARRGMGRNIVVQIVSLAMPPLLALVTAPVLAHGLGVTGRGEVAAGTATLLFLSAVLTFGLQESVTHHVARYPGSERTLLIQSATVIAGLGVLGGIGTWFMAPWLADGNPELTVIIRLTAALVAPTLVRLVPRAIASGRHQWGLVAWESWLTAIARAVTLVLLWLTGHLTVLSAALTIALVPMLCGLVYLPLTIRVLRTPSAPSAETPSQRAVLGFGLKIWLGSLSGIILTRVDQVLMVPLSNEAELGLYAVAASIGEVPTVVSTAVRNVVFAADSAESDPQTQAKRLQQASRLAVAGSALAAFALGATMHWWIPPLFGPGFADAWTAAVILLLATVVGTSGSVAGAGLGARGRPGLRSISMAVGACVNLLIFLVTVGTWGVIGAALSTLAGAFVSGSMNIVWLRRVFGIPARGFYGIRSEDVRLIRSMLTRLFRR
ncbi:oligosaccharide flippase family protein [Micrococcus lylae]|uniref:oligosaccharide flippase family protein n=1 Tax=Micrococcus lylae TaxID=1273 RepID=UPI0021553152|nr:oligosaccharide flippase family protein [Micrococcus lylae]WIK82386.1 oligosaccharide flippase family protein [Micrococcus lylae]